MVYQAKFSNFKALRSVAMQLGRLTVVVGPNASGKSSILEGIHLLSQLTRRPPDQVFAGPRAMQFMHTAGEVGPTQLMLSNSLTGISLTASPSREVGVDDETPRQQWTHEVQATAPTDQGLRNLDQLSEESRVALKDTFGRAVLLRLDADRLAAPSYSDREIPCVEYNGEGLASVLAYMKLNLPDEFEAIVRAVRQVVPSVLDVRFARSKVYRTESQIITVGDQRVPVQTPREYWGDSLLFDTTSGTSIAGHLISEGTLLTLGLLTVVMGP